MRNLKMSIENIQRQVEEAVDKGDIKRGEKLFMKAWDGILLDSFWKI